MNRIAYEQALSALGQEHGIQLVRPHTVPFLEKFLDPDDDVLELGGGQGVFTPELAARTRSVTYVDRDLAALKVARKRCAHLDNISFLLGDGFEPAIDMEFTTAVLLHVLEHLPNPLGALKELSEQCERVLIEVPDLETMPALHVRFQVGAPFHSDDDHCTEFTASSLTHTMAQAGWKVVSLEKCNCVLLAVGKKASVGRQRIEPGNTAAPSSSVTRCNP